ncbi:hypothetical protein NECAME_17699, partial [Necator americanus]
VHHVTKFFDDHWTYQLEPNEGVVRHYRDIAAGNWGKIWLNSVEKMGDFSMTDYPKQFESDLLENVKKRLQYVYGKS